MRNAVEANGIAIARTPQGIGVAQICEPQSNDPLTIQIRFRGRVMIEEVVSPLNLPWREYLGAHVDHLNCAITVRRCGKVAVSLDVPNEPFSFMLRNGPQHHITESYVSVPPALTITDEVGAVWTLGFSKAAREQSPDGEFAFNVLRDGINVAEIASRIERRSGKIRIFTRHGWKVWNQVGHYFV